MLSTELITEKMNGFRISEYAGETHAVWEVAM